MYFSNEIRLICNTLKKCGINTAVIKKDESLKQIVSYMPFNIDKESSSVEIKPATVYRYTDMLYCKYVFFLLPGEEKVLLIGPFVENFPTNEDIVELLEKYSLSAQSKRLLENYYATVPVFKKTSHIYLLLETFYETLWRENGFKHIDISSEEYEQEFLLNKAEYTSEENDVLLKMKNMELRYKFETELMNAVSSGNISKAELLLSTVNEFSFESRTTDQLRNIKNYCIIMNTLLRKAAENGGVHPIYIDSVSSDIAVRIEKSNSISVVKALMDEMFRSYCRLVKKHSMRNYSVLVQKTIACIDSDLTGDLSLNNLSNILNVSPSYLSTVFKKETGQTLTEYVNQKRIKNAMQLLATTKIQIQTAAQHSGIDDVHYFTKLFKKYTGKTPKEYRQSFLLK